MVARINTIAFQGIDVQSVDVQVQVANGLPAFTIVGLPDKAVAESKERVRAALHSMGLSLPPKRLTVNMAPADLAKEGSHFDLPIAIAVLSAMDILPKEEMREYVALGELSLDGVIRAVAGVLPAAMHALGQGMKLICPQDCGQEACWAGQELDILAPTNLLQLINHFKGHQILRRPELQQIDSAALPNHKTRTPNLRDVRGQETAKRALEIAAAGGHNMLMIGPPGSGKSMLASCVPGILPELTAREALEISMIHSIAGTLPEGGLMRQRPFRDPHHSASLPALIGGGHRVKPGEISLAHQGILFLDELPEFNRTTLESLRQPLETGQALIARANSHVTYPARFQLIAAMNPCRCGYLGDPQQECTKAPLCGKDYQARLSGPLLDRIDLVVDVPPVRIQDLSLPPAAESSQDVAQRVQAARDVQSTRYARAAQSRISTNAEADSTLLEEHAILTDEAKNLFDLAAERARLSARAYFRVLRVARTIADLDSAPDQISKTHIAEALSYRRVALN